MTLLTLADAKAQLNIAAANTQYDAELQDYVDAVSRVVQSPQWPPGIGPIDNQAVTEVVSLAERGRALLLSTMPVVSVDLMTSVYDGGTYDVTALYVENAYSGVVRHKRHWPIIGIGPWTVGYTVGRGGVASKSANLAGRIIVAHLWETQRGRSGGRGPSANSEAATAISWGPSGFAVPNRALELLSADRLPEAVVA